MSGQPNLRVAPATQDYALLLVDLQTGAIATIRTIEPERYVARRPSTIRMGVKPYLP